MYGNVTSMAFVTLCHGIRSRVQDWFELTVDAADGLHSASLASSVV